MASHLCCFTSCHEDATVLMVDVYPSCTLFRTGAGLVCEKHAYECERDGKGRRQKWKGRG